MFKNYLKFTVRNLKKLKTYTLINLLGLTVGISCALLAVLLFLEETSFDKFHENREDIYRVVRTTNSDNGVTDVRPDVSGLLGPALAEQYPEVTAATRLLPWFSDQILSYEQKHLEIGQQVFADANFFEFFDFQLIRGNPANVLSAPNTIVLTESVATALFGTTDPIGKTILGLNEAPFNVTGIVANPPVNSHIVFNTLMSWSSTSQTNGPLSFSFMNNWLAQTVYTYLNVLPGREQDRLEANINQTLYQHLPQREGVYTLSLQPLDEVYLGSAHMNGSREVKQGSYELLQVFGAIALFILIIACLNYINISTSKAAKRAQEIGVRKVLGASRSQLVIQFVGDALVMCFISTLFAILLTDLFVPYFNNLTGKTLQSASLLEMQTLSYMVIIMVAVSLIAGLYPALMLSSIQPAQSLKKMNSGVTRGVLRQGMMVSQFTLSTMVIIGAVVVYQQNDYLLSKDLGFNKEQLIVLNLPQSLQPQAEAFRNEATAHSDVVISSLSRAAMGDGTYSSGLFAQQSNDEIGTEIFAVDHDFIPTWQLELVEGRAFDRKMATDTGGIIVNEAMVKAAGWETGLGKTMRFGRDSNQEFPIIGVVKDFNYAPLTAYEVSPVVMYLNGQQSNLAIRLSGNNMAAVLKHIENSWNNFEDRVPFDYYFVDQQFADLYQSESRFFQMIMIFSIVSIVIACMGLYGLTAFTIEQRIKEIGIRKILGAGVVEVLLLINKRFALLILLAFVLAVPVGYLAASQWLDQFPYRVSINAVAFLLAGIMVLAIAALTTCQQVLKASKMNPVNSLRYE